VGNTHTSRDFLDVRDAAAGLMALMDSDLEGPVNVCSGRATPIREIAKAVCALAGISGYREEAALGREVEVVHLYGDTTRLRSTGWLPRYPLGESLAAVWAEARAALAGSHELA
jgi:nucleoside-diphosphate-sugar epimerase